MAQLRRASLAAMDPPSARAGRESPPRLISALGPTIERHGVTPASPQRDDSVVWCSPPTQITVVGQDEEYAADPHACTDLWVYVDARARTIAVDFEGNDLVEFITGTSRWDDEQPHIALTDDLDGSLTVVADHIDQLCDSIIVRS